MTAPTPFSASDYAVPGVYLDSAGRHPLPRPVVERLRAHAAFLGEHPAPVGVNRRQTEIRALFATLIGADIDEIALVPSAVMAENFVLNALDLPGSRHAIVTDALHFAGSLDLYGTLAAEGTRVRVVPESDGRIEYDAMADALSDDVGLVTLSSVSHRNGFEHDLPRVCTLAHRRGALVYADITQHAGALPLDVRASGVDFCACSSFKWLLGDMGLGFLYVRRDRWPLLRRVLRGARQQPLPEAGGDVLDPSSQFHIGTLGASAVEALSVSLPRTTALVNAAPETLWRPLTQRLDQRMTALGLTPLTPPESRGPIRAYAGEGLKCDAIERLRPGGLTLRGLDGYLRVSPSVFSTLDDIDAAANRLGAMLRGE